MARGKRGQRSGLLWKRQPQPREAVKAQTPDEMAEAIDSWMDDLTLERRLASARSAVDRVEELALKVFARNGLPAINGTYRRPVAGGDWEPAVPTLAEYSRPEWKHAPLSVVGQLEFPADSEVGFAVTVLERVRDARIYLETAKKEENWLAIVTFAAGLNLWASVADWREEFVLGDWVAPTKAQVAGRREGGRITATAIKADREREWRKWQTCADDIWATGAALSKAAVARLVVSKLKLDVTTEAVRKRIEKPGRT